MVGPAARAPRPRPRSRPTGSPTASSPTTSRTRCCPRTASSSSTASSPRAPTSGSPGTATPTAASSSTTAASSSTATSSPRCSPSRVLAKEPGATILYDVRASRAVPDTVASRGGTVVRQPRRPRLLQAGDARARRGLRRRGLRPLLLPRLLVRRLGHDPGAAGARAALGRGPPALGAGRRAARRVLHLRRDQLRGRRPARRR